MSKSTKILDSSVSVTAGSRADLYWRQNGFADYLEVVRPNLNLSNSLFKEPNIEHLQSRFAIRDIGFGNWVTNSDRFNYINSLIVALYDLNKVTGFKYNIGFGYLSVTFGARGHGKALAHYEPLTKIINITRYKEMDRSKIERFVRTGGMGAFAHEYGHFLDYFAGEFLEKDSKLFAITGGRSVSKSPTYGKGEIRIVADQILEKIIWKTPGERHSDYYTRLKTTVDKLDDMGEYYIRRNEIFARWFEAWVAFELNKLGIKNLLLAFPKYDPSVYPTDNEVEKLAPLFKRLCRLIKSRVS